MQSRKSPIFLKEEPQQGESITDLISDLASQSAGLVRDEVALAKQEVSEKLVSFRSAVIIIALGAVLGLIATLALSAAAIAGLAQYVEFWQAALLVGGALAVIAGIVVSVGLGNLKRVDLKPKATLQSLEENKEWLKEIT
jgi:uncharacterized membrane protein YqjE